MTDQTEMAEVWCPCAYLLGYLELLDHPDLIVHLDPTLDQLHLCAIEVWEVELVDLKLLNELREILFLKIKTQNSIKNSIKESQ